MNFQSLNRLNGLLNVLSGNFLPLSHRGAEASVAQRIYGTLVSLLAISYLVISIIGTFYVPKQLVMQNSTVNVVVTVEVILLYSHMQANKNLLRELIKKLNGLLDVRNEALRNAVITTLKPLEKPFQIYAIVLVTSVAFWISLPLVLIGQKNEFYYKDFEVPAKFSPEPFSIDIFIMGVLFETLGSISIILKKVGLDVYTMYLIRLVTSQYRYLRTRLAFVIRQKNTAFGWTPPFASKTFLHDELKKLLEHHATVVETSRMLKQVLALNVGIIYMDNVFRFCFLGFMFITLPPDYFEKTLLVMYTAGAVAQLFVLCFCAEQLLEASVKLTDDVFYEGWYTYNRSVRQVISFLTMANKLECKLSAFGSVNLTVASLVSVVNQAYSACLIFLRVN